MHSPNGLKIAAQGGMFSNDGKPPPTSDETKEWIKPGFFAKKRAEAARRAAADPTDLNGAKEARNALGELKNWAKKHKVSLRNKKKKSPVSKQKNLAKEAEEKITKPRAKGKSQFKPPAPLPDLKIKKLKWAEGHAPHLEPDAEEIRHKKEVARRRAEKEARIARENPWRKEYEQMKVEKKGLHVAAKRFHEEGVRMHKEEIAQNKRWKEEDARLNKIAKNKKMLRRRGAGGRRGKSKRKGKHGRKNKNKRVAEVPPRRADGASEYVHHPSATPSKGRPGLSGVEPQLRAHPAFAANGGPMPGTATHGVPTHFAVSSPDVVKSPNLHEHDDADVEEEAQHLLEQTGGDGEVDVEEMDDMMQAEEDRRANGDAGDWDMDLQLPVAQHVDNERLEDEEEVTEGWETDDF